MDQIEYPLEGVWQQRRNWFETLFDIEKRGGAYLFGEQSTGLLVELQAAYCAGAFIACIILACTIVDSHIRETEAMPQLEGGIKAAFELSDFRIELEWLRERRNRLIHFHKTKELAVTVDDHFNKRDDHEHDAKRAIAVMASVLFETPWV